jgi:hypothetical protein
MDDEEFWWIAGCVLGLCACTLLQLRMLRKLRADVDFLTVVSRESLRSDRV